MEQLEAQEDLSSLYMW